MAQRSKKTKTSRKYAKGTVSQKWGFFRRMLEAAVQCGLIPGNPVAELSPNGGRRARRAASPLAESKTMDQQERAHLLCIAVEKLGGVALWAVVLFALMALAGLRFGEARALQRPDLELDHRHPKDGRAPRIHVRRTERLGILGPPKHGRARYVSVVPILEQLLREYVKTLPPGSIWLFPGQLPRKGGKVRANYERGGHPLEMGWCVSETGARSQWHVVLAAAQLGRKLSPKALRHAFCTIALSQGQSLEWVSREMGHRDVLVTQQVYGRWAQPWGLGTLAAWLATQRLPERSFYGEPDADAILAQHGVSRMPQRPGASNHRTPFAA
ncbi:MAG: hypothetical protein BVN29_06750 [Nitrospira sp. ST-bin5]|nr:MAG: hypothetical protein BVN29_06750 [Nitrospira sp. ST-bin5]